MMKQMNYWLATAFVILTACNPAERDEVARVASPDGALDGVVVETNSGATASFGYEVHIVRHGAATDENDEKAFLYGARRNEHAYGVNLRWLSPRALQVEYESAISAQVPSPSWNVGGMRGTIRLQPGISDRSAPAGSMSDKRVSP